MKKTGFMLALLTLLGFSACKPAQKTVYTPEQLVPTEKSVLWKISGNGLKKPSFLLGTIHLIPKADFKVTPTLQLALVKSEQVTFEIDMKEMTDMRTQMSLLTKAFMPSGITLKTLLNAEDYQFVRDQMKAKGLPGPFFEKMKPLFLSMMFSTDEESPMAANSKMTSVEMELYKHAKKRNLATAGLETTASQLAIFDSIPYEAQAKMLVEGLRTTTDTPSGDGQSDLDKMLEMYRNQDISAMQQMIGEDGNGGMGAYEDVLLGNRNRNWIPIMGTMMKDKPTLFAVGAGHLGGKGGVIALLRQQGYKVEPVYQ